MLYGHPLEGGSKGRADVQTVSGKGSPLDVKEQDVGCDLDTLLNRVHDLLFAPWLSCLFLF